MARIAVEVATLEHALQMAPAIRAADRREIEAGCGVMDCGLVLRRSLLVSFEAWAGTVDGEVACIFGLSGPALVCGEAEPWLLGTDLVERHALAFARRNRPMVRRWSGIFQLLRNFVHADNATSIRWLRWLGFSILPLEPFGPAGAMFHPFEMRQADV